MYEVRFWQYFIEKPRRANYFVDSIICHWGRIEQGIEPGTICLQSLCSTTELHAEHEILILFPDHHGRSFKWLVVSCKSIPIVATKDTSKVSSILTVWINIMTCFIPESTLSMICSTIYTARNILIVVKGGEACIIVVSKTISC